MYNLGSIWIGENMNKWYEIFAKFVLDVAKIVFTTLIIGRIITPSLVNWVMFIGGMIVLGLLISLSYCVLERGD